MNAIASERIEIDRESRDKGLAFTGLHFRNPSEMQRRAAHHLDVVMTLANLATSGLANHSKCIDEDVLEIGPITQLLTELDGPVSECFIGQSFDFRLEGIDLGNETFNGPYLLAFAGAQNLVEDAHENDESTDAFLRSRSEEGEDSVRSPLPTHSHDIVRSGVAAKANPRTVAAPASRRTLAAAAMVDPVVTTSSTTTTTCGTRPRAAKWTP
ncbi:unannotated protein [freshwater metagenome]|uniref:Unannotated protein n=1 Tax=freshwater metagenome TaxID=449393 RepID=A0A6J7MB66_9ZZZZ